ncbi:MAG: phosphoglycerate dehydrogenase [Gammaproteobacteria bacterium]
MYKILTLNNISVEGLERLPQKSYAVSDDQENPDAILLRSHNMHKMEIPETVKAIGRAGAGVNNIPIDVMNDKGVPVFNAPGANANAVKELVIVGMLLAARNICQAWDYVNHLTGDDAELNIQVEAGKKKYVGFELPGKTLGVVGLGAIGVEVANAAHALGMKVIGFDPDITVQSAWKMEADVHQSTTIEDLLSQVDFVSFHVPLIDATRHMINAERLQLMKEGVVIMNFARNGIIDDEAVIDAMDDAKVHAYVSDFPSNQLKGHARVISLPHLGASTKEAEDNCAIMVVDQIKDFLENGNIRNSVNFPKVYMKRNGGKRITIANKNIPNMLGQISTALADSNLNIVDMINKSRNDIAYTLVDVDEEVTVECKEKIESITGVLAVRVIE